MSFNHNLHSVVTGIFYASPLVIDIIFLFVFRIKIQDRQNTNILKKRALGKIVTILPRLDVDIL